MSIPILFLGLAFTYQAADVGARPWEVVVSQEGKFSVEMPQRPNRESTRTRSGPDGKVNVLEIGCRTEVGGYFVYKIELPTAVVRGAEQRQLDVERDEFARDFNGKVITEKRVSFERRPGRDFTIRAEPVRGGGLATIRVREYFSGKAVYALMVASIPNRELPDDAGRFLGSLRFGTNRDRSAKTDANAPEPAGRALEGWGTVVDPDGDCKIAPTGTILRIEVPGNLHDLNADISKMNAPRVLRAVDGDFVAQVKVVGAFQPGGKSTNPKSVPYNGAGLFVWSDANNYIRLERAAMLRGGKVTTIVNYEEREEGNRGAVHNVKIPAGTVYLRLQRRGGRVNAWVSLEGRNWQALKPIDVNWPPRVKVGISAINSNSEPFSLSFEEFSVKGPSIKGASLKP